MTKSTHNFEDIFDSSPDEMTMQDRSETLQQSDDALRVALEIGKMGIWDWDVSTDKFTWSDGIKPLYGFRQGNIGGNLKKFLQHVYPADRKRVERDLKKAVKARGTFETEFRILWPDNSVHWMFKKGRVILDKEAKHIRITGIGMDVTTRKLSESILKLSENKFKSVFDASLDAIIITDDEKHILDLNAAGSKLFDVSKEQLIKKNLISVVLAKEKKNTIREWKKLQKEGYQRAETTIQRPNGTVRNVEYSANAQFLPNRALFIFRDITDRKKEELRREHLLGIVSHELRTPLASIKAFAEILHRKLRDTKDQSNLEYLSKIDEKTGVLAELVSNLLDMTRMQEGRLEFFYELFEFDSFLKDVLNDIQVTLRSHKIIHKGKVGKEILADRNRLTQIIINLVKNAAKYSPNAEKIIVKTSFSDHHIHLSVQDFGIGIPKKELQKIFDIFYRIESPTHKRVVGLGVGLYITSEIVKKHGGNITAKSVKGKGSTFFVTLPLQPPKPE